MSLSSLASANFLALNFLTNFHEVKESILKILCKGNGQLLRKFTLVNNCLNFYKTSRLLEFNDQNGTYHAKEIKIYQAKIDEFGKKVEEKYLERKRQFADVVLSAIKKISDDYNEKVKV